MTNKLDGEYEYLKYVTDAENLRNTLSEFGVAIIPSILNEDECRSMLSGMWDFFEHITRVWEVPISRNDEETWSQIYKLYPMHSMLFQYWNIGHAQTVWDLRQNNKILTIFSNIWNCNKEDLLCSFDGASFNVPFEVTNRGYNRNNLWLHTDQSYTRNNFECIQSWITALDVNEGDATLGFLETSNNFHQSCRFQFDIEDKKDWYKLSKEQEDFYRNDCDCPYKKIKCPKGSLVLWDSRTIHCGVEGLRTRQVRNFRAIVYLCYTPRNICSSADLKKKRKAFEEMRMTSHWPSKPKLFPVNPRTYGGPLPEITKIDRPVLSELGLKLAGF
jgi:hypothetical protein